MKEIFEIHSTEVIESILDTVEYGTLSMCDLRGVPYGVPINFARIEDRLAFHGSKRGKKMEILSQNPRVSFSVVEALSLIDSDFSSESKLACPATQFYRSVHIEGVIERVIERKQKAAILQALMEKLQPKGGYLPLDHPDYEKALEATELFWLRVHTIRAKAKVGQHLPPERYERIVTRLKRRDTPRDRRTLELMAYTRTLYKKGAL